MDLEVEFKKTDNKPEAYQAVKSAITPELLARFKVTAEITYKEDNIHAKGKGFKLDMDFNDIHCVVSLDLSFLLKPLRGKILEAIEKQINRVI